MLLVRTPHLIRRMADFPGFSSSGFCFSSVRPSGRTETAKQIPRKYCFLPLCLCRASILPTPVSPVSSTTSLTSCHILCTGTRHSQQVSDTYAPAPASVYTDRPLIVLDGPPQSSCSPPPCYARSLLPHCCALAFLPIRLGSTGQPRHGKPDRLLCNTQQFALIHLPNFPLVFPPSVSLRFFFPSP